MLLFEWTGADTAGEVQVLRETGSRPSSPECHRFVTDLPAAHLRCELNRFRRCRMIHVRGWEQRAEPMVANAVGSLGRNRLTTLCHTAREAYVSTVGLDAHTRFLVAAGIYRCSDR